jgi:gas vesicle protein
MSDVNQGNGSGMSPATAALIGAAVGAAVGAGCALLFAPCSGKESRQWLADRTRDLKDRTASALEQGKEAIRRTAKEVEGEVRDLASRR